MKVDIVKIRVDDNLGTTPKMAPEIYRAVIDEAHKKGLRVAVHLFYLDDAKAVLEAGADFIAHSVRDVAVDDAFIAMLKRRDVCYCPTLMREVSTFVYESTPPWFGDPLFLKHADTAAVEALKEPARQEAMANSKSAQRYKVGLEVANRNLKKLSDAGVTIAMGTDTGPPARFQGYFELMELEMMAKAGLTPRQVLAVGDARRRALHEARRRARHARAEQVGRLRRARRRSAREHLERAEDQRGLRGGESTASGTDLDSRFRHLAAIRSRFTTRSCGQRDPDLTYAGLSSLPGTAASAAGEADLRVRAVAERLVRRPAAAAQRERPLGDLIGVAVPVDQRHVVAFDQIRTVLPDLDGGHRALA